MIPIAAARRASPALLLAGAVAGWALWGGPVLVVNGTDGARLTIGRIAPARAQAGGDVVLEDVAYASGTTILRAPRVELRGTALSRADAAAILDGASAEPWSARLARLTAAGIAVPELTVEQSLAGQTQRAVYRGLVARGVAAGRVEAVEVAGVEVGAGEGRGTYGRLGASDVDLPEVVRLYAERAGPGDAPPRRRLYGAVSADALAYRDPSRGIEVGVGHLEARDVEARLIRTGWSEAAGLFARGADRTAPPAQRREVFAALAEILDAFAVGGFEMRDLTVRDAHDARAERATRFRVDRLTAGGGATRLEGVEGGDGRGGVRLASLTLDGFSLAPTIAGLRAVGAASGPLDPDELRRLTPDLGTLRVQGLEGDVPDSGVGQERPGRVRFGVRSGELRATKLVNGIPSESRLAVDGLTFALPEGSKDAGVADLAALGYRDLDLSWLVDLAWSEAAGEVAVREVSLRGKDMGRARLAGTFAGLTRDIFDPDRAVATVALMSGAAKQVDLLVEDDGLFGRLVAQQARQQRRSPEEVRRDLGAAAAVAVPSLLGNSANAKALATALARFVAKPGRLAVTARARNPAGLGVADFAAAPDPTTLLNQLDLTATAD